MLTRTTLWSGCVTLLGLASVVPLLSMFTSLKVKREALQVQKSNAHGLPVPIHSWKVQVTRPRDVATKPKVLLISYGTRGDVQPFIALALELSMLGIRAILCCPDCYKSFVELFGVEFQSMQVANVPQPDGLFDPAATSIGDVLQVFRDAYPGMSQGILACVQEHSDCGLIICAALTRAIAVQVAEYSQKPIWIAEFAPAQHTTEFPPSGYAQSRVGLFNKLKYFHRDFQIVKAALRLKLDSLEHQFRTFVLGLPAKPIFGVFRDQHNLSLQAWSTDVQNLPCDYPIWAIPTGFWRIPPAIQISAQQFQPSSELLNFVAYRPKSKLGFVTFGSMEKSIQVTRAVVHGVLEASNSTRIVVCLGGSKATKFLNLFSSSLVTRIHCVSPIPYCWILPKCSFVVHHGGAGTSGEAMFNGVPSIVVPLLQWSDQPYWGEKLQQKDYGVVVNQLELLHEPHSSMKQAIEKLPPKFEPISGQSGANVAATYIQRFVTSN